MKDTSPNPGPNYSQAQTPAALLANFAAVQARIDAACARVGRDPAEVQLLPVSKTIDHERLRWAYAAGCRCLGENKAQELAAKQQRLTELADLRWIAIGHLQTNKAKLVAQHASAFHALDSLRLAEVLQQRLAMLDRQLDVLVQVNTSGEPSKYGLAPDQLADFLATLPRFDRLRVGGLMTLAVQSPNPQQVRGCFSLLRQLRATLRPHQPATIRLDTLSMGMSGDFELAIEEGATQVRVGQALFGARALPHQHYWPDQPAPHSN
ncbi:YggS family pyridoxal phosphate-dependent enzyme [Chitinolyticbacter meiyuanensis]|uniref:YggS family pyridoxal phosphate-dependent enzyme n=1 Tax=Chitinolyticbacter meiyuanensis TaxID=682798 RepID=UPI0011E5CFAA|nr:YggS family pyridoxal phosphate-dependent enzyme [Chitinolyticbacter meiyuanensis]